MILYLDTSALVKLFVPEDGSEVVRAGIRDARVVATQLLAYAEACSAFARLAEMGKDRLLFNRLRRELDAHWSEWEIVQVEEPLVRRAGELCFRYRLRGDDSVHLAAAERVHAACDSRTDFRFGVFDATLMGAARSLRLNMLTEDV